MMQFISGFGDPAGGMKSAAGCGGWRDALRHRVLRGAGSARCAAGEFLLRCKFLGVQMMMFVFVLIMLGLNYLLAWIGGATIQTNPLLLMVYPMVRYMLYSALGILLVTFMHPIVAFCIVLVMMIGSGLVAPGNPETFIPGWLRTGLFYVLPSSNLLSEHPPIPSPAPLSGPRVGLTTRPPWPMAWTTPSSASSGSSLDLPFTQPFAGLKVTLRVPGVPRSTAFGRVGLSD